MSDGDWKYVCEGCQTEEDTAGRTVDVDKVRDGLSTEGTAETLASIHETLTGHNPKVGRDA